MKTSVTKAASLCCLFTGAIYAQGQGGSHYRNAGSGWMGRAVRTPVTGAPYSATRTTLTERVLADGNHISRTAQSKVYRDTHGRTRVERTITPQASSGKQPFTMVTIVDPVAGYRYVLNSSTMTAFQTALPTTSDTPPARTGPPQNAQVSSVSLGTQTINGVPASGTQVTRTIPAGAIGNSQPITIVRTRWISTALKVPVEVKSSDPRFGTIDMELTGIQQAEPDPSLFSVPPGYTVKAHARFRSRG
jgi:hypothetical protein